MSVAAGAITRMLREPASTREKMSRPFVSVPNGKPHSGGRLVGNWLSKIGSYRVTSPGKIAQKIQKASTSVPMSTVGERRTRRSRSVRAARVSRSGGVVGPGSVDLGHSAPPSRIRGFSAA